MPLKEIKYDQEMLDGRRKLSTSQKEDIISRYELGDITMKQLADEYKVSTGLILVTVNPISMEKKKASMKRQQKKAYNKENNRKAVAKYRAKKRYLGFIDWKTDKRTK